ncbi:dihydroxyacetone kinase phosphoryl donor subunit DhaM [Propionibacterium australiense]|uniref:phosphoenolpyruvate--glycerone phosphotransferase n=1 Tax=Propionibacterium australiense TaxID=119981 RepID=A0A383S7R5_9ACTN|nr:dihydroxyacetone kinase phosphoryl donor subunit DhaM [Propionibacterium australiense]RLP09808.1 dihydroxyacetone kinase [Propionibacterium australiense]RLP10143.1 dihydroxyacetone kinase [Propionibacterium australiense]SYZ33286.1 dha_pts: dihydroxyacetone kinase, phosphotransfer subunit [Propionibacterium australiense]VEH89220.1 PTS-dependent dihydroxyacetone kinase, phosphotransferase subunit dhaM [Propionibacterium australiense]
MIGIVVVSHSPELADAAVSLARGLMPPSEVRLETAAGTAEGTPGTDAMAIVEAIGRADDGEGVVVLMDLGSAVMSAQTAIEFLDPEVAERTRLLAAPLVEGLFAAYSAATIGRDLDRVCAEAEKAADAKRRQLAG